jgi:transposase InsO family protein
LIEQQVRISRKRVVRLMQEEGLKARVRKRYKHTTLSDHDQPIADNRLKQTFDAARPNQRWVGDTTEFVIGPVASCIWRRSSICSRGLS